MKPDPELPTEPFTADGLERLLERAEHDAAASEELDLLCDVAAAAELERGRLARPLEPRPPALLGRQWLLAVAATVLFALVLAVWYLGQERAGPRARDLARTEPPVYVASELRAPGEERADAFERAMERYAAGEYERASLALSVWLEAHPEHGPARFYLAAAREQLGLGTDAEADYRRVAREQPGLLGEHARWRLAQLSLARDDAASARTELEVLAAGAGSFAALARELLARLDEP